MTSDDEFLGLIEMPKEVAVCLGEFSGQCRGWRVVGTQEIFGSGNDYDVLLLTTSERFLEVYQNGLPGWTYSQGLYEHPDEFVSLRNGQINLLLTADREYFQRWDAACQVCKLLQIQDKNLRVKIHQIVMDGDRA